MRPHGQLMVMGDAEVICMDGVDGVEAVVIRHADGTRVRREQVCVPVVRQFDVSGTEDDGHSVAPRPAYLEAVADPL
jgi:hypothetical protein